MTVETHEMDEQQFLFLQQLLTDKTGIRFRDRAHLSRKLGSRLRALNLDSYARYIELIKKKSDEILHAIEAVTTNETFFFRDFIHLIALEKYLDNHLSCSSCFQDMERGQLKRRRSLQYCHDRACLGRGPAHIPAHYQDNRL